MVPAELYAEADPYPSRTRARAADDWAEQRGDRPVRGVGNSNRRLARARKNRDAQVAALRLSLPVE